MKRTALARGARQFDARKHPRGAKGRFIETPDEPKKVTDYTIRPGKVKPITDYTIRPGVRKAIAQMAQAQKAKLAASLEQPLKPTLASVVPVLKNKVTKKDNVTFNDKSMEIWQNNAKQKGYDPTFKVRVDKQYEYSVQYEGKTVVLNRNRNVFEFQGEVVRGVPSLHPHLREMKDEDLFKAMASTMTMAESSKPSAPKWDSGIHGQVQGIDKWRYGDKENYYGEMQVHHVGQWTKIDIKKYNDDVRSGKLSVEDAKKIYDDNVFVEKVKKKDKATGATVLKDKNSIQVAKPGDREFVMLAAGVHDTNSSLFAANHNSRMVNPYHPQLKTAQIGIPEKGKEAETGSRQWFDTKWKPKFWKEVYRRESYVLRGEIQRRIDKGLLPLSEAKKIWDKVHSEATI